MKKGFTLVELLIVIAIIGILASIALVAFRSSQIRSRDAQRKSDLKQIANSLELLYADYSQYPPSNVSGQIMGCNFSVGGSVACSWGSGSLSDGKTTYFKVLPKDPSGGQTYFYRTVNVGGANQGFQLYAHLENSEDQNCLVENGKANCSNPTVPGGVTCSSNGDVSCNFSITSPNVTPTN